MFRHPNILLLLSDQHVPSVAGYNGNTHVRTNHLDRLAAESVNLATAHCASPICTPSRMCLLTGRHAHRCAAWNNHWVIFPERITWPRHFANHGYTTALIGKMHLGGRDQMQGFMHRPYGDLRHGLGHQPDPLHMFPGYGHATSAGITEIPESLLQENVVTRETLAFLLEHQDRQPDKPWFACASYSRPHAPFTVPGRYLRRYKGLGQSLLPASFNRNADELDLFNQWIRQAPICQEVTRERAIAAIEAYYACVDFVDDCIGELLAGLDHAGMLENTIVIYTSDHGEMLGQHGLWGKTTFYEPSVSAPLLIRGPGIAPGAHRLTQPVSLIDLYPTTCALAGLDTPADLDGRDFSDLLRRPDQADAPRRVAISEYYRQGIRVNQASQADQSAAGHAWRAIRTSRWKYVAIESSPSLLFDLENDPDETCNLADDPQQAHRCQRLHAELFADASWQQIREQRARDTQRLPELLSGLAPSTPNQYMLADGRVFDAEASLYHARWRDIPQGATGGIIPQQFG